MRVTAAVERAGFQGLTEFYSTQWSVQRFPTSISKTWFGSSQVKTETQRLGCISVAECVCLPWRGLGFVQQSKRASKAMTTGSIEKEVGFLRP